MASLDGYSLNQKIDKLHSEIVSEIEEMQMAFGQLYSYMKDLENNKKEGAKNA